VSLSLLEFRLARSLETTAGELRRSIAELRENTKLAALDNDDVAASAGAGSAGVSPAMSAQRELPYHGRAPSKLGACLESTHNWEMFLRLA
jgi:hypothetical protein